MKNAFKITGVLFVLLAMCNNSSAQVKEVNPGIQWKMVRSDSLPIVEGNSYIFKFPAMKIFDYILTFQHGEPDKAVTIEVYDMQGALVMEYNKIPGKPTSDIQFNVDHNATYELKVRIGETTPSNPERYSTLLAILKREKT